MRSRIETSHPWISADMVGPIVLAAAHVPANADAQILIGNSRVVSDSTFGHLVDGRSIRDAVPHRMYGDHDGNVWVVDTAWLGSVPKEGVGHVVHKYSPGG